MINKAFLIQVIALFSILHLQALTIPFMPESLAQKDSLTADLQAPKLYADTASLNKLIVNELKHSPVVDMLDSLVNIKFFTNTTFPVFRNLLQ